MNNMYDEYLMEELEQAETDEEKRDAIVNILKHRPEIRALMTAFVNMDDREQLNALNVFTEATKPHTVSM